MTSPTPAASPPRQPLLNDATVLYRAPTQVWSRPDGTVGGGAIDGIYHGDVRHVRELVLACDESEIEWTSAAPHGPSGAVFGGLLRGVDDATPDPKVRLLRERTVADGRVGETLTVISRVAHPISVSLALRVVPEFASLHEVKSGMPHPDGETVIAQGAAGDEAEVSCSAPQRFRLRAPDGTVSSDGDALTARWQLQVAPGEQREVSWHADLDDPTLVVRAASRPAPWSATEVAASVADSEPRLGRWLQTALDDLDALRLALPDRPDDDFFAAGAPWFFTLFGRDSLWAARLALPVDARTAASTLRVLAGLQGTVHDGDSAQEPGKILHELRATTLDMPGEGISLPPRYYGSVDSTPLWVCLLADAWRAGMADDEVRALVPALVRALRWMLEEGDSDGDGFLDYVDVTGRGLSNQGWKDSGDSIQWRGGTLADGPIALCEVQGYAYEAALAGAELLEAFGTDVGDESGAAADPAALRAWAADLKERFARSFWVETPEGRYPAIALDRDKRAVDTLSSNIGHLLGTGIVDAADEARIAALVTSPAMASGFGIRTLSTDAAGYWPLSYHGGTVWTHDTAIIVRGLWRCGRRDDARLIARQLLDAAESFAYRVPELHSGDPIAQTSVARPYPAACRPQAWSSAAAVTCLEVLRDPAH